MANDYLRSTLRIIIRNKIYTIIKIISLSLSLAISFILSLYIINEASYDKYNEKLDDIYVISSAFKESGYSELRTPYLYAQSIKETLPQAKETARVIKLQCNVSFGNDSFQEETAIYADPQIFSVLTLPIIYGNESSVFSERDFAVINERTSEKYFGSENPIGKEIRIKNAGAVYNLKIIAVMKNIPDESTLQCDLILPLYIRENQVKKIWAPQKINPVESWDIVDVMTYVLLDPRADLNEINNKLNELTSIQQNPSFQIKFGLFPLNRVYFHSAVFRNNSFEQGDMSRIYIYIIITLLILITGTQNFIFISVGRSHIRLKEIGIRKVLGASHFSIIRLITYESLFITFISFLIAIIIVWLSLQTICELLGKQLPAASLFGFSFILLALLLTIFIGLVSGIYISNYISKSNPTEILRDKLNVGKRKIVFRRIILVAHIAIFIGLIFSSLVINKQLNFFHTKDFGFNKDGLVVFSGDEVVSSSDLKAFKNKMKTNPNILDASVSFLVPGTDSKLSVKFPSKDGLGKKTMVDIMVVDENFFETMGMKIIKGVSFKNYLISDSTNVCIVNETAVKELGLSNPVNEDLAGSRVVGVVKDFNLHSLREKITPVIIQLSDMNSHEIVVRISKHNIHQTIEWLSNTSKLFNNGKVMNYEFFDDRIDHLYLEEEKFAKVIDFFTLLAIFIAGLGLFGMSLIVAKQRTKEISIRRVLGASKEDIIFLLFKELLFQTVISSIIAIPITIYFVREWLNKFAYRVTIDTYLFILTILFSILIVAGTFGFQVVKVVLMNPVNSLRSE